MTNDGVYSLKWDAEGKMISVTSGTTVSAIYDALVRMVEQARGTSYTQILPVCGAKSWHC